MALQNINRFQKSITKEIDVIKDRVRDLIGNANWGEEGRYKEAVLRKAISQFLPVNLKIGSGFIVGNDDHVYGENPLISTQIDLIIYEDKSPVIFREGDFVILTDTSVRAVIEVKSKIINYADQDGNSLNHVLEKFNSLRQFPSFQEQEGQRKKFIGLFAFEYNQNFMNSRVVDALIASDGFVNHICLGPNKFIKYWSETAELNPPIEYQGRCYIRYNLTDLSFSYFISNLLHIVADEDPVERYWFSFPIQGTKEQNRAEPIIELPNP